MGADRGIKQQSCCLAVLPDLESAGLAYLELHLKNPMTLAVSILNKPKPDANCADFFRLKTIGTITCRGSVAKTLTQHAIIRNARLLELKELLDLIGIPTLHETIYGHALKSGQVVLVLQGDGECLRQGCDILKENSVGKPVLYLV